MNNKEIILNNKIEIEFSDSPIENYRILDSKKSTLDRNNKEVESSTPKFNNLSTNKSKKDFESLSDINFIKKEDCNLSNTSENVFVQKIIQTEDIYLETSNHNPFLMSINSNNLISGTYFKNFLKQKKNEILKDELTSQNDFLMKSVNQTVFLEIININNFSNSSHYDKGIQVFIKLNNISITAFNIKTNLNIISGEYFPIMHLNFNSVSSVLFIDDNNLSSKICVLGSEKAFILKFLDKRFFIDFNQALNQIIKRSIGYNMNLYSVTLMRDFYKVNFHKF